MPGSLLVAAGVAVGVVAGWVRSPGSRAQGTEAGPCPAAVLGAQGWPASPHHSYLEKHLAGVGGRPAAVCCGFWKPGGLMTSPPSLALSL